MRAKVFLVAIFSLLMSGCASVRGLEQGLPLLEGQHVEQAIAALGYPNDTQNVDDNIIYIWHYSYRAVSVMPVTTSTKGTVGGDAVSTESTTYTTKSSQLSCTLRIITTPERIVKTSDFHGPPAPCSEYSDRLIEYFRL